MLFNSFEFLAFFPIVLALYYTLGQRHRWVLLLAASYVFYAAWNPAYLALIIFSTLVDYWAALKMGAKTSRQARRPFLLISLCSNLGLLAGFKYLDLLFDATNSLLLAVGGEASLPVMNILLPVGISFYTFQTLSYAIDVYRGDTDPERNLGRFALYVSFFPQLVAGPIERSTHLLPMLRTPQPPSQALFAAGMLQVTVGFFKKVVIADRLAFYVDMVFSDPHAYSGPFLLFAAVLFSIQIYCDFSGYTDIAIGTARMFGIELMQNFNRPYMARSIRDFWQRWHISLTTWFRDYLYIPLGGNRRGGARTYANIMVVFLLSGLWHGANYTFLAWGLLHGVALVCARTWSQWQTPVAIRNDSWSWLGLIRTWVIVIGAWIVFRADSVGDAMYIYGGLHRGWAELAGMPVGELVSAFALGKSRSELLLALALVAGLLVAEAVAEWRQRVGVVAPARPLLAAACNAVLVMTIVLFGVFGSNEFIYFQF